MIALGRRSNGHKRSGERGVTLVELLVAVALMGLALGTVATLATAVLSGFEADPAAAEQQQRTRSGINALLDDVQSAGSGFVQAADDGPGSGVPALFPAPVSIGAWPVGATPRTLTTLSAERGAAHARLRSAAVAGDSWLRLERPAFCPVASSTCGFAAGADVLLFDQHGRFTMATVAQVTAPLDLEMMRPLAESWRAGAFVSAVVAHAYAMRADASTGLFQLVRSLGDGPANPVIDLVTRFDVEWHAATDPPVVRPSPDGTTDEATAGPRPPRPGVIADPAWPAGENCAYGRDAAGAASWRGAVAPLSLATLDDGPWCPSPGAPSRWDLDLARVERVTVTLGVAVASARLRPPLSLLRGATRVVPDLTVAVDLVPGRRNGGR